MYEQLKISAEIPNFIRLCPATFLIFFSTTTGTGVVSPYFFTLMYSSRLRWRHTAVKLHPLRLHKRGRIQHRRANLGRLRLGRLLHLRRLTLCVLVRLALLLFLRLMVLMVMMNWLLLSDKLDLVHPFNRVCLYSVNHVIKHVKTFTLIFNEGIFLSVPSKPDTFFQVVH